MRSDNVTEESLTEIYDGWMSWPLLQEYYGNSRYMNVGFWQDDTIDQHAASQALVHLLMQFVDRPCSHLLDVGCGQGASVRYICDNYQIGRVDGVNISTTQLDQARMIAPAATFSRMSATDLRYPANTFDVVICIEAAFHFDTRLDFFREANRVLVPGGLLVISDILYSDYGTLENALVPSGNESATIAGYSDLLVSAGFSVSELRDITENTWSAYKRRFVEWAEKRFQEGKLSSVELSVVTERIVALNVSNYIAAAAEKL